MKRKSESSISLIISERQAKAWPEKIGFDFNTERFLAFCNAQEQSFSDRIMLLEITVLQRIVIVLANFVTF